MCSCEEQLAEVWTTWGKCPANCYPCAHSDVLAICCRSCEKRSMNLRVLEANELCFKLLVVFKLSDFSYLIDDFGDFSHF